MTLKEPREKGRCRKTEVFNLYPLKKGSTGRKTIYTVHVNGEWGGKITRGGEGKRWVTGLSKKEKLPTTEFDEPPGGGDTNVRTPLITRG